MSRIFGGKPVNSVVNTGLSPGFVNPLLDLSLPVVDNHSGKKSINVKSEQCSGARDDILKHTK